MQVERRRYQIKGRHLACPASSPHATASSGTTTRRPDSTGGSQADCRRAGGAVERPRRRLHCAVLPVAGRGRDAECLGPQHRHCVGHVVQALLRPSHGDGLGQRSDDQGEVDDRLRSLDPRCGGVGAEPGKEDGHFVSLRACRPAGSPRRRPRACRRHSTRSRTRRPRSCHLPHRQPPPRGLPPRRPPHRHRSPC